MQSQRSKSFDQKPWQKKNELDIYNGSGVTKVQSFPFGFRSQVWQRWLDKKVVNFYHKRFLEDICNDFEVDFKGQVFSTCVYLNSTAYNEYLFLNVDSTYKNGYSKSKNEWN